MRLGKSKYGLRYEDLLGFSGLERRMTHRRDQIATLEVDKGAGDEAAVIVTTFPERRRISLGISSLVVHLREALAWF